MKKIVASVGLVALGASAIQTASGQALAAPDASKPWSVSATLRGFYDDNPGTIPNSVVVKNRDTFGFEVAPTAAFNWVLEQTTINLGFLYSLKYYDTKPPGSADHTDQTFTFNGGVDHTFSEQFKARVSDSFVVGQEPDLLRAGNTFSTFQRISGDNIRNYGTVGADAQLTPAFGLGFGYDNALYDYKASGATLDPSFNVVPSVSGVLDRIEQRAHLEGLLALGPQTKGILGYQFTSVDYTGNEYIGGNAFFPASLAKSNVRNTYQHTVYIGAEHNFMPDLTAAVRVGASYTDYYNDSNTDPSYTPYVNASVKYTYAPESSISGGISYDRNATDVVGAFTGGKFTTDAESGVIFLAVNHRIDPRLFASVLAQFQNSTYNGGDFNNQKEQYYLVGLDLEYKFNQFFSGHIGYNYDRLESDLGRTFDRNRVYIGVTASY